VISGLAVEFCTMLPKHVPVVSFGHLGEAVEILLASSLSGISSMCPNRKRRCDWVSLVVCHTAPFHTVLMVNFCDIVC